MSTRRVPRTLDERVAALEEFVRRLQSDTAVSPTDTRYLYDAKGDILIAAAAEDPQPLHVPAAIPAGVGVVVPRLVIGSPLGVEWAFLPGVNGVTLT